MCSVYTSIPPPFLHPHSLCLSSFSSHFSSSFSFLWSLCMYIALSVREVNSAVGPLSPLASYVLLTLDIESCILLKCLCV